MDKPRKEKLLRVQGPRSTTGCQTCKIRHVKCDEATPICNRCIRSKRTCYYGDHNPTTADAKFIVYGTQVPTGLSLTSSIPPSERRALSHFQHRTLHQIEGAFRSELWSTIVPQLMQVDTIVRQAVIALSAFHEQYLDENPDSRALTTRASQFYQKARQQIIQLDASDTTFDSILCACAIFGICEGLQGNFEEALKHQIAGVKIIAAQKTPVRRGVSIFASTDGTLPRVFLELLSHIIDANADEFHHECPGLDEEIGTVPARFESAERALPHLFNISNRLFQLHTDAEVHHQSSPWIPSQISPKLKPQYDEVCATFDAWRQAISRMKPPVSNDNRHSETLLLLKIYMLSLEIDLHVFVHGEPAYDNLIEINYCILSLIEAFLRLHSDASGVAALKDGQPQKPPSTRNITFTATSEVVSTLFEIATRTRDTDLCQRAVQMLRSCRRREGVWDGALAASFAEQLVLLKAEGNKRAEEDYPGCKFLVTHIELISSRKCLVRFGFKRIRPGSFESFWLEEIRPGEGTLEQRILTTDC